MQQIVLVIHLLIALGLVGLVLLQRSEGGGLGMGGGGGGGMMSVRGTASFLTRATGVLARPNRRRRNRTASTPRCRNDERRKSCEMQEAAVGPPLSHWVRRMSGVG